MNTEPCIGSSISGPFCTAISKPDSRAPLNSLIEVLFSLKIYSAVAMFLSQSLAYLLAATFELKSNFGSISGLPASVANLLKIDYDGSLNILISKFEPRRGFGPKPEQKSLISLINF